MPKQPGGINKSARIEALRQVLKRWGRLNKTQIDEHVSSLLHCSKEELARALYRDLDELLNQNEIQVIHFSRDGVEIPHYDPETHKNTFSEWIWGEKKIEVLGSSLLKEMEVSIHLSPRMQRGLSVHPLHLHPQSSEVILYFFFDNHAFTLEINSEDLPLTLVVGRTPSQESLKSLLHHSQNFLSLLENGFGKRSALLLFPTKTLSSFKNQEQLGHLTLELKPGPKENPEIRLKDLQSKNGTWLKSLSKEESIRILHTEKNKINITHSGWGNIHELSQDAPHTSIPKKISHSIQTPALIGVSIQFKILIL